MDASIEPVRNSIQTALLGGPAVPSSNTNPFAPGITGAPSDFGPPIAKDVPLIIEQTGQELIIKNAFKVIDFDREQLSEKACLFFLSATVTGDGRNHAAGVYLADTFVSPISEIDVPFAIYRYSVR